MPRILIPVAALMLMTGPALAAPGLGASSWSVNSETSSAASENDKLSLFEKLARVIGLKAVSSELAGGADATVRPSAAPNDQECKEQRQGKTPAKEPEKKTAAKQTGPEPVYLAF
ncbi:hypothetical protein [Amphiplicatus metriothermophilus]|uniref:Uncharacterized protein n=1 Tax=Amphiplicatus metriothermophilus TaxID=1519374 RepID=A0A239PX73_9PROT|nr:hypothetical protein [Amphiplicatus metriothermophilus]MBB5519954.1 hypothetical protein [Amphiplicatus metriothermophilus]SNT74855.1 hypothetical protein SAMN06297382_2445 [Amphiplicatus metriothermophilus]